MSLDSEVVNSDKVLDAFPTLKRNINLLMKVLRKKSGKENFHCKYMLSCIYDVPDAYTPTGCLYVEFSIILKTIDLQFIEDFISDIEVADNLQPIADEMYKNSEYKVNFVHYNDNNYLEMLIDPAHVAVFEINSLTGFYNEVFLKISTRIPTTDLAERDIYADIVNYIKNDIISEYVLKIDSDHAETLKGLVEVNRVDLIYTNTDFLLEDYENFNIYLETGYLKRRFDLRKLRYAKVEEAYTGLYTYLVYSKVKNNVLLVLSLDLKAVYGTCDIETTCYDKRVKIVDDVQLATEIFGIKLKDLTSTHIQCLFNMDTYEQFFNRYSHIELLALNNVIDENILGDQASPYVWNHVELGYINIVQRTDEKECVCRKRKTHYFRIKDITTSKYVPVCSGKCLKRYEKVQSFS